METVRSQIREEQLPAHLFDSEGFPRADQFAGQLRPIPHRSPRATGGERDSIVRGASLRTKRRVGSEGEVWVVLTGPRAAYDILGDEANPIRGQIDRAIRAH